MNGGKSNSENNKMNGKSNSEVYSLFIKEKASEASLHRSLTQAGKERDYAYNEMKKSQSTHQLAVAKHEKLQHELEQKKMTVELIYDAWKRIDAVNNNVDVGVCKNKMDGINDKVDVVRCDNDTVGISMPVGDHVGNGGMSVGQNEKKAMDTSLPVGVVIHVGVDNDGKNDVLTKGLVGAGNGEGDGRCGTGEFDNEEEANDALLVQAAKETEALLVTGQIKRVSTREVSLNMNMDSGFGGDGGIKSGSTLSVPSQDAGSPGRKKGSSALAIISPERQVNEETNKAKTKASAPHLNIGSVDSLKPAAALAKRARKAK
jgi:hypothetical protein